MPACAAERDGAFWAWWGHIEEQHADDARVLLGALLWGIAERIGHSTYRGCPFLNLATEFPDDSHPGRVVARSNKEELRATPRAIAGKNGVGYPDRTPRPIAPSHNRVVRPRANKRPAHPRG